MAPPDGFLPPLQRRWDEMYYGPGTEAEFQTWVQQGGGPHPIFDPDGYRRVMYPAASGGEGEYDPFRATGEGATYESSAVKMQRASFQNRIDRAFRRGSRYRP